MYLERSLKRFFPGAIRQRGEIIFKTGQVRVNAGNQWKVEAAVQGSRVYSVSLVRTDDALEGFCDCPFFESTNVCKHVWATILAAEVKNFLLGRFGSRPPTMLREEALDDEIGSDDPDLAEAGEVDDDWFPRFSNRRRIIARRVAASAPKPKPQWRKLLDDVKLTGAVERPPEAWNRDSEIYFIVDVPDTLTGSGVCVEVMWRERRKDGDWGKLKSTRIARQNIPAIPDERTREILLMLGGAQNPYEYGSYDTAIASNFRLKGRMARLLLPKICATDHCRLRAASSIAFENQPRLEWDDGPAWMFRIAMERAEKNWAVRGYLQRADERMDLLEPELLTADFLFARGKAATLDAGGNFAWIKLLGNAGSIPIPASHGPDFVAEILNLPAAPPVDWPEELRFERVDAPPKPHLKVETAKLPWRAPDLLWATLSFDYGGRIFPAGDSGRGSYDPSQRRFWSRNAEAEKAAADRLASLGLKRRSSYNSGSGADWEFASKRLPKIAVELVKDGWHIESDGKVFRQGGNFHAELSSGIDWFELHGEVDYGSEKVHLPELLRSLEKGESLVRLGDGSYGVIPDEVRERFGMLLRLGRKHEDHVRFSRAQTGLLDVLLVERPEVSVDEIFSRAREELRRFDGIAPAEQPASFVGQLRDYQLDGLAWMHFLRQFGFGGCLADDMGVGKTPQVLALLDARRESRAAANNGARNGSPSLAVVPRSVVYNWKREAEKFTPALRILDHTGGGRAKNLATLQDYDLILTTYGTLRRDAADFQKIHFDYVVLDEAQAIKNAGTESAKAARLLNADHRLAMSGTPVENHLGELWSLFEFLNPGMLGAASVFQAGNDSMRNPDEEKRRILARAVRPFILRRTKEQVARELPPKVEQTVYCELDATQRRLYNELRDHYRTALLGRVERDGMARSRIQILEALLRLRQAACHPGLIDPTRTGESSAKLEALLPQLAEVVAEGHKALVFSQFTSFLSIVKKQLTEQGTAYEYLDGKTRDREACVDRFQNDPDCKLFLVSLKAGGLGLNLCAAEYVFLLDPWWNPAAESQAIDRAHRIGQTNSVFAYRLIARETVEEKVIELQNSKRDLADAIIRADTRLVGNLKREDLELLLS